ncbi:ATPase [bacterium]|nr:ATPase [bacterium]
MKDTKVELFRLLDQMEELMDSSRQIFGKALFVDVEKFFFLLNRIRVSLPEEIKRAAKLDEERERILQKAREEAEEIVKRAREEAERLTSESEIIKRAQQRGMEIIAQAEQRSREIITGAEEYARDVLMNLENYLSRVLNAARKGITELEERLKSRGGEHK